MGDASESGCAGGVERGVAAISTAVLAAPFSVKDSGNELLGQMRAAGMFLRENGQGAGVQQIKFID